MKDEHMLMYALVFVLGFMVERMMGGRLIEPDLSQYMVSGYEYAMDITDDHNGLEKWVKTGKNCQEDEWGKSVVGKYDCGKHATCLVKANADDPEDIYLLRNHNREKINNYFYFPSWTRPDRDGGVCFHKSTVPFPYPPPTPSS